MKKYKFLFTTIDGVDIYKGDKCYWITSLGVIYYIKKCNVINFGNMKFKHFSTRELAEKYLKENLRTQLFTTSDKVDIYKGDDYFFVSKDFTEIFTPEPNDIYFKEYINLLKSFSTRKLAENYVLYNSPCISLYELSKIYKTADKKYLFSDNLKEGSYPDKLLKLVKEKTK